MPVAALISNPDQRLDGAAADPDERWDEMRVAASARTRSGGRWVPPWQKLYYYYKKGSKSTGREEQRRGAINQTSPTVRRYPSRSAAESFLLGVVDGWMNEWMDRWMDGGHTMEKRLANFPRANIIQRWIFLPFPFHAIHLTVLIPLLYFCCCRWCRSFVAPYYNTPARPSSAGFAIPSAATRTQYSPHSSPFGLTDKRNESRLIVGETIEC